MLNREYYPQHIIAEAYRLKWAAEVVAGVYAQRPGKPGSLAVPPIWTAWLLMARVGLPTPLIAYVSHVPLPQVRKRLVAAKAMMVWPPYGARIERLLEQFRRHAAEQGRRPDQARFVAMTTMDMSGRRPSHETRH